MDKAIFLDRDGVINKERGEYTYKVSDFEILIGVKDALAQFRRRGFLNIIITNQAGISRGLYSIEDMQACHTYLLQECKGLIDDIYYCPWHPDVSNSLMRKPDSVMLERALAKYNIGIEESWMVGDKERDVAAGKKTGLKTCLIENTKKVTLADCIYPSLGDFAKTF